MNLGTLLTFIVHVPGQVIWVNLHFIWRLIGRACDNTSSLVCSVPPTACGIYDMILSTGNCRICPGSRATQALRTHPPNCPLLCRITGHKAFEDTPLAVHDRLEGAHADGGGLLGQFFNPLTGKSSKAHGHTITLGR